MKKLITLFILVLYSLIFAESLWRNNNLFVGKKLKKGDSIKIVFKNKNLIEFSTFQENYESASINNPYKKTMIINFLPQFVGDNQNKTSKKAKVKNKNNLNFSIMAEVVSVNTNGYLLIKGAHQIKINNQIENITIEGLIDPERIKGGKINSDDINNLSLNYNRTIYKFPVIKNTDITTNSSLTNMNLTQKKKEELLLEYFNQILPLLFQK